MKKFFSGLICGILFFFSLSVCAGGIVSVSLAPSHIQFHLGGVNKQVDETNNPILNYNDRTYIPLRAFSETLGETVNFQIASASTHYINQIDIYTNKEFPHTSGTSGIQDAEGYVTLTDLKYKASNHENGESELVGGKIQINKALSGKKINIFSATGDTSNFEGFSPIFILNESIDPIKVGDIRPFTVPHDEILFIKPEFKIIVKDETQPIHLQRGSNIPSMPLFFESGILSEAADTSYRTNRAMLFEYHIVNLGADLKLQPVYMKLQIFSAQNAITPIYTSELPAFSGTFKSTFGYQRLFLWDKRDQFGHPIQPGKYFYRFLLPSNSSYQLVGENKLSSCEIKSPLGGAENNFNVQ